MPPTTLNSEEPEIATIDKDASRASVASMKVPPKRKGNKKEEMES